MDHIPGLYKVISPVWIRREPRIIEYRDNKGVLVTNVAGALNLGDLRRIDSVITDAKNVTWGKISEPDAAGKSLWVCIQDINRTFMEYVEQEDNVPIPDPISCLNWMKHVDQWARGKGYTGPHPWE